MNKRKRVGICPNNREPTEEDIIAIEIAKAEVQARWSEAERQSRAVGHAFHRPVEAHVISITEMICGAYGTRRRPAKI